MSFPSGAMSEKSPHISDDLPDHADALASILEYYAQMIRAGQSAEDMANRLIPILRVAARRV